MTDRELLELAAKAAGLRIDDWNGYTPVYYIERWSGDPREEPQQEPRYWSPLDDDGDALRLAVKLGEMFPCFMLGLYNRPALPHVGSSIVRRDGSETYIEQDSGDDVGAATRRAIVRAAAEMGRMK